MVTRCFPDFLHDMRQRGLGRLSGNGSHYGPHRCGNTHNRRASLSLAATVIRASFAPPRQYI